MLLKNKIKALYDEELKKQTDAYTYYIENVKEAITSENVNNNEGEHENVPFICMNGEDIKFVCEDDERRTYECDDYFIYESKKGSSSIEEKAELVTNAIKSTVMLTVSHVMEKEHSHSINQHMLLIQPGALITSQISMQ